LELAAGYKNIIAMVGDMINRLSQQQIVEDFKNLTGIVLIDEIDLHLHPKYQKLFVQKLTELFPKIQFIVSTHSPIPLLGAPKNSVIINVSRTREEGIKAELLDIDFSVLTPNAILSSPIFGFQDLIPDSKSKDKMARSEDSYKEVLLNDQLDKQISEYLTEDNQKELLDLLKEHNL
jgi:predicted ATP-binding protein involved in virulence